MKKLEESTYVLHNKWSNIKNIISKNIKYLAMPSMYLLISLLVLFPVNTVVNRVTYTRLDSYVTKYVTNEEKVEYILNKYNLTKDQFKVVCAVVLSEAEGGSYDDAYAVINTIYNRTHSKNWVRSANARYGKNAGYSLYYQVISPNQFSPYLSGSYVRHLNDTKSVGYQAIIDFLYTEETKHDFLSFRSSYINIKDSVSFSEHGNNYFNVLTDENRI